jgi:uncharacterized membrane protein YeaQ/YmgE (transglycosylase-associated protein family)
MVARPFRQDSERVEPRKRRVIADRSSTAIEVVEVQMSIVAWIVLGAMAGYLAGFLVKGDEGLGVVGHVVLGIVGAVVGGFLAGAIFGTDPIQGQLDGASVVTAVIGAVLVVMVISTLMSRSRTGRGTV